MRDRGSIWWRDWDQTGHRTSTHSTQTRIYKGFYIGLGWTNRRRRSVTPPLVGWRLVVVNGPRYTHSWGTCYVSWPSIVNDFFLHTQCLTCPHHQCFIPANYLLLFEFLRYVLWMHRSSDLTSPTQELLPGGTRCCWWIVTVKGFILWTSATGPGQKEWKTTHSRVSQRAKHHPGKVIWIYPTVWHQLPTHQLQLTTLVWKWCTHKIPWKKISRICFRDKSLLKYLFWKLLSE